MEKTDDHKPFSLPAVEQFVKAVGYHGEANLVAVYWGGGDEAYWSDGRMMATGEWSAYLLYVDSPLVRPHIKDRWSLGSSEEPATHWLVINRQAQTGQVLPVKDADELLVAQYGTVEAVEPIEMSADEFQDWLGEVAEHFQQAVDDYNRDELVAQVEEHMAAQRELERDLRQALEEAQHPRND